MCSVMRAWVVVVVGGWVGGYVSACLWVCVRVMHARWGMSLFCCELMVVDRGCTSVRWRN